MYAQQEHKKIFFCTGALSGDYLSAWYCKKLRALDPALVGEAIAGKALENEGIILKHHFNDIQATHLTAASSMFLRIFSIPSLLRSVNELARYFVDEKFTDLVLVDFPFFNLPLARAIKKISKNIKVTYVAPPELWFWRSWGIHYLLKWYCDKIVVLYPFEKYWYKQHLDLEVEWIGYPFYERLHEQVQQHDQKKHQIALIPGSRMSEVKTFLPILAEFVAVFHKKYPEVTFILPLAETISRDFVAQELIKYKIASNVIIVTDGDEKLKKMSSSCLAISKPGTTTLELAILKIPSVVMCRVGWMTYWLSCLMVPQKYVSLPNIFLDTEVFKEFFQSDCTVKKLMVEVDKLYQSFLHKDDFYKNKLHDLDRLDVQFSYSGAA